MGRIDMNAVKIRCRDLMVGDWITNRNGFPMQITNVGEDYAYANFKSNEGDVYEFDDNDNIPMPIPISREILEKNGWAWHEMIWGYNLHDGKRDAMTIVFASRLFPDSEMYIEWREGNQCLSIWYNYLPDNEGTYSDIVIPVRYVHEMQQVLRRAGLTDVANNFKV